MSAEMIATMHSDEVSQPQKKQEGVPSKGFASIMKLHSALMEARDAAGLTEPEFTVLSMVRSLGHRTNAGALTLPVSTVIDRLVSARLYRARTGAHGFLTKLADDKGLLGWYKLTPDEKELLFPDATGYRSAVSLTSEAIARLGAFDSAAEPLARTAERILG